MAFPIAAIISLAATYAPGLIRHLAGEKAGDVADKVLEVGKALTGQTEPDAIEAALKADPALAVQFRTAMANVELDLERAYLADRQDARARDVAMRQIGHRNWRADILAVLAAGGLLFCVWLVARDFDLPERASNAIMFVAGVFAAALRDVFAFEFGSSRSSKDKDEAIRNLTK